MSDLERLSERLAEDERWRRDLTDEDATPLLDAGLALLDAALAVYTPEDPAGDAYQSPYREASAGLVRDALGLAGRALTHSEEAGAILRFGLRPLHWALGVPGWEEYQARIDALLSDPSGATAEALAGALRPTGTTAPSTSG